MIIGGYGNVRPLVAFEWADRRVYVYDEGQR